MNINCELVLKMLHFFKTLLLSYNNKNYLRIS